MDTFNVVAGAASILGLLAAMFVANKCIKKSNKTKITQTAFGTKNKQTINYKDK